MGLLTQPTLDAQEPRRFTENVFRLNLINPSVEYEFQVLQRSTLSTSLGIGMQGAYKRLVEDPPKPFYEYYLLSSYAQAMYRVFYNLEERITGNKNIAYNSGNYFGIRFMIRGPELYSRFDRKGSIDFSYGPAWGLQRALGRAHIQLTLGPVYYFDTHGNSGFSLLMLDLNFGYIRLLFGKTRAEVVRM